MIKIDDLPEPIRSRAREYYQNNPDLESAFLWLQPHEGIDFWRSICSAPDNNARLKIWYEKYPSQTPLTDKVRRGEVFIYNNASNSLFDTVIKKLSYESSVYKIEKCAYMNTDNIPPYSIPLTDIARELGLLGEKWEPKPGEMVEVSDSRTLWEKRFFIGKTKKGHFVTENSTGTTASWVLCRPIQSITVTRQEIADWKGCSVEQLNIEG